MTRNLVFGTVYEKVERVGFFFFNVREFSFKLKAFFTGEIDFFLNLEEADSV